jgi:transcriptional antiterminator
MTDLVENSLNKAARIAYLVLLLEKRNPGRPPHHEFDSVELAQKLGVSQRSVQRDLHDAWKVRDILHKLP